MHLLFILYFLGHHYCWIWGHMKTADSPARKILGSSGVLKFIQKCFVGRLCAWLIQLSLQIRWLLVLRTAVWSLAVKGDGVCGQPEVSMCTANYLNVSLFGTQLGEATFEYWANILQDLRELCIKSTETASSRLYLVFSTTFPVPT